jgi:hypothetical protein
LDYNEVRKYVGQGDTAYPEAMEDLIYGKDTVGQVWFFCSAICLMLCGEFHSA